MKVKQSGKSSSDKRVRFKSTHECEATDKCKILREPDIDNSGNIWSLDQEYKVLRDENLINEPLEIYLNYCQRYCRQNLKHINIKVDGYKFS